jgi:hypothetical protein
MAIGLINFVVNLTLVLLLFWNMLLSRDIESPRLLRDVNKAPFRMFGKTDFENCYCRITRTKMERVNDICCKPKVGFVIILKFVIFTWCVQKMAEGLMNYIHNLLWLLDVNKRSFCILTIWQTKAINLNLILTMLLFSMFIIFTWCKHKMAVGLKTFILDLFWLLDVNKANILNSDNIVDTGGNFKHNV